MNNARISIVLPVHNGQKYLDHSIASICDQTFKDWELIIVDDASVDETPELIKGYCRSDSRIRSIRIEKSRRLPGALNRGFSEARGEYYTWTSDDNMFRPQALAEMAAILDKCKEVDIVYANRTNIDANGEPIRFVPADPIVCIADHNPVGACFLYRSKVHDELGGYDESMFLAEDYDFWLRASCRFTFQQLEMDLYFYREHGSSLTGQMRNEILKLTDELLEKRLPELRWIVRARRAQAFIGIAERYRCAVDRTAAVRLFMKALYCHPWAALRDQRAPAIVALYGGYRVARLIQYISRSPVH